jgi:hypothetical protein
VSRRVLADLDAEVLLRIANRDDISETQRAFHIDDAYRWVSRTFEHPENEATTTGSVAIAGDTMTVAATDVEYIEFILDTTNGRKLLPGDKNLIEERNKVSGTPGKWHWWGGVVYVDRKPTVLTAYKLWYIKKLAELTTGQSSVLNQIFDPIIIMKAASIGLSTVRDFEQAHIQDVALDNYVAEFKLPKRMQRYNNESAGIRVRMR